VTFRRRENSRKNHRFHYLEKKITLSKCLVYEIPLKGSDEHLQSFMQNIIAKTSACKKRKYFLAKQK